MEAETALGESPIAERLSTGWCGRPKYPLHLHGPAVVMLNIGAVLDLAFKGMNTIAIEAWAPSINSSWLSSSPGVTVIPSRRSRQRLVVDRTQGQL